MLDRTIPPKTGTFEHLSIPGESIEKTPGGITLHIVDNGTLPVNRVCLLWNYGNSMGAYDGCAAIAGFIPELIREGSSNIDGATLAETIDFNGAWLRARSADNYSLIDLISLNHTTPHLLDILSDIFCNASLPEKAFEALRTKAARRRELQLSKVSVLSQERACELINGYKHPYLNTDTVDQINNVSYSDIISAYNKGTKHSDIHVFVGGQIDESLHSVLRNFCEKIRPNETELHKFQLVNMNPEPAQTIHIDVPGSLQNSLSASIPTPSRNNPDYIDLRLAIIGLGGYFGSRLMSNIREEKGLTYGISASLLGMQEGAHAQINAQYAIGNTQQVIDEIRHELQVLASQPMPIDELTRLKRFVTSNLAATLDSPFSISDYYQNQLLVGTPADYFDSQFKCINSLTPERIMHIASKYLNPDDMRIVTAGSHV
jgi:predicted Zn-dependent peptidase